MLVLAMKNDMKWHAIMGHLKGPLIPAVPLPHDGSEDIHELAELFLGRPTEARRHLQAAVAGLPETSAWHHLASLYLTLADIRE